MRVRLSDELTVQALNRLEAQALHQEIFGSRIYLLHGIELHEGDVIFDVGANIGLFTLFVSRHLRRFEIYAFEPIPEVFAVLRRNTSALGDKVKLFNVGLSDQDRLATFTYYPRITAWSTCSPGHLEKSQEQLRIAAFKRLKGPGESSPRGYLNPLRTLALDVMFKLAFAKKERRCRLERISRYISALDVPQIDLLKIDVEGSEWDVLRGVDPDDWRRIKQVVMEVNLPRPGVDEFARWLSDRGYQVTIHQEPDLVGWDLFHLYARRIDSRVPSPAPASVSRTPQGQT